jgi:hypothetical protein
VYVEQQSGPIEWIKDIPATVELLHVPTLLVDEFSDRRKVLKFWGKTSAQISAVRNRSNNERVIWVDSDVEQVADVDSSLFSLDFEDPVAIMNSEDGEDCWETGIVIFNQQNGKLGQLMKKYEQAWRDEETLASLWKPYDAQVLGHVALDRGYYNLCNVPGPNINALSNSIFGPYFKHWINKENKDQLIKLHESSNNIS